MRSFPPYTEFYLPHFSKEKLERASQNPNHVVIVPLGAIEQHGPHLPVGTDSLIGEILLNGLTGNLNSDVPLVIAPALTFSKSNEHHGFPGTLLVQKENLIALTSDYLQQLKDLGFSTIAFLNTHGGNTAWLRTLIRERCLDPSLTITLLNPMPQIEQDPREASFGIHAGEYESSLLYAAIPEACKPDLADCQWIDRDLTHPDLRPEFSPVTFAWAASDLTPSGTMGDATKATAKKGDHWITIAVDSLVAQVQDLLR